MPIIDVFVSANHSSSIVGVAQIPLRGCVQFQLETTTDSCSGRVAVKDIPTKRPVCVQPTISTVQTVVTPMISCVLCSSISEFTAWGFAQNAEWVLNSLSVIVGVTKATHIKLNLKSDYVGKTWRACVLVPVGMRSERWGYVCYFVFGLCHSLWIWVSAGKNIHVRVHIIMSQWWHNVSQ